MEGAGMPAAIPEPNKQNTASDGQSALAGELLGADSQVSEAMTGPQTAVSAVPPEANERVTGGSSQSPERGSGVEAPASSRPATPANHRYSTPHSRPTSPVPSLRNLESCRPSSSQRPDSPSEPSKTVSEKGPSSPRANSPFLQKAQSFGRSNVSARRVTSMLVEKRAPSGLRAEYEEDQISPRAFEVKPLADTDGLCAVLYHYLWRKTSKGKGCPGLNLPDTIVYRYRQPTHWFFTSVHDGQLMKKNRANVLNRMIFESLSKSRGRVSDVVACHLYTDDESGEHTKRPNEQVTHVEYFDEAGLKNFLFHGEKQMHGVLQRFVESKGDRNALIQAMWSPQFCLLERRINLRRIKEPMNELHEKAVTFEGAEQFSESVAVPADALATEVQRICKHIVDHVAETSSGQSLISRMVLHFKVDAKNKIWLLWCSSIRLFVGPKIGRHVTPLNLDPPFLVKTTADAEKQSKHGGSLASGGLWFLCPGCGETFASDRKCDVTYKAVIYHWQKTCTTPGRDTIPPVIAKANTGLSEARYAILREHPVFLYKTVPLCESCCTERNNSLLAKLAAQNPASYQEEAPSGGRRLGVPSLAGALRKMGAHQSSASSARARLPATSRPAPKPPAAAALRPRPRSAFAVVKGRSSGPKNGEGTDAQRLEEEKQDPSTTGGDDGNGSEEYEAAVEGTIENETSDSGRSAETTGKTRQEESGSTSLNCRDAANRDGSLIEETAEEQTKTTGLLAFGATGHLGKGVSGSTEEAEGGKELGVLGLATSLENTGGGGGCATFSNGEELSDVAQREKYKAAEANVLQLQRGHRKGATKSRKLDRTANGHLGSSERKEAVSKGVDGSVADRARAIYSKKIVPLWAVPKS